MEYTTEGIEPLAVNETVDAALKAVGRIEDALSLLGPGTAAFGHLAVARAEASNWLAYLSLGGYEKLGNYEPLYPVAR